MQIGYRGGGMEVVLGSDNSNVVAPVSIAMEMCLRWTGERARMGGNWQKKKDGEWDGIVV